MHLLMDPLSCCQYTHNVTDQRSIEGYFGATGKQLKRIAEPLPENTEVNEKKKQFESPTVRVRKFQESWKDTFPWVVQDANQDLIKSTKFLVHWLYIALYIAHWLVHCIRAWI